MMLLFLEDYRSVLYYLADVDGKLVQGLYRENVYFFQIFEFCIVKFLNNDLMILWISSVSVIMTPFYF